MPAMTIQPLHEMRGTSRMPECGRIRIGVKVPTGKGKERPKALDTFRITSQHRDLIERVAELYGGTVKAWNEASASMPNQWQVITETNRLRVALPAADQAFSQYYEAWSGGGCLRRCDGETCQGTEKGADGSSVPVEVPCLCAQQQVLLCKIHSRLTVILPDVPLRGSFRLETQSDYAARELAGMVDVVLAAAGRGFVIAELGLDQRKVVRNGETKRFVVPTLTLPATPEQLLAGGARLVGIAPATSSAPALPPAPPPEAPDTPLLAPESDDGIIDAEIIEERDLTPLEVRCFEQADRFIVDRQMLWDCMMAGASDDPTREPLERIEAGIAMMERDEIEPIGFKDGRVQWAKTGGK